MPGDPELRLMLVRIEGKQDLILHRVRETERHIERQDVSLSNMGHRIAKVETKVNYWAGGLAVIVGTVGLFGTKIRETIFG